MNITLEGPLYFVLFAAAVALYFLVKHGMGPLKSLVFPVSSIFLAGGTAALAATGFFIGAGAATSGATFGAQKREDLVNGGTLWAIGAAALIIGFQQ